MWGAAVVEVWGWTYLLGVVKKDGDFYSDQVRGRQAGTMAPHDTTTYGKQVGPRIEPSIRRIIVLWCPACMQVLARVPTTSYQVSSPPAHHCLCWPLQP